MDLLLIISTCGNVLGRNALCSINHRVFQSKKHAKYGNSRQVALQRCILGFNKGCSLTMATQEDSFLLVCQLIQAVVFGPK